MKSWNVKFLVPDQGFLENKSCQSIIPSEEGMMAKDISEVKIEAHGRYTESWKSATQFQTTRKNIVGGSEKPYIVTPLVVLR